MDKVIHSGSAQSEINAETALVNLCGYLMSVACSCPVMITFIGAPVVEQISHVAGGMRLVVGCKRPVVGCKKHVVGCKRPVVGFR